MTIPSVNCRTADGKEEVKFGNTGSDCGECTLGGYEITGYRFDYFILLGYLHIPVIMFKDSSVAECIAKPIIVSLHNATMSLQNCSYGTFTPHDALDLSTRGDSSCVYNTATMG